MKKIERCAREYLVAVGLHWVFLRMWDILVEKNPEEGFSHVGKNVPKRILKAAFCLFCGEWTKLELGDTLPQMMECGDPATGGSSPQSFNYMVP
jgi:hypothetical protein